MKSSLQITIFLLLVFFKFSFAEEFYVDPLKGKDTDAGTREHPFATLSYAVQKMNMLKGQGQVVIRLLPGIYRLHDKVELKPLRTFTDAQKLVIEAVKMPDDNGWKAGDMPVILCDADTSQSFGFTNSVGILVSCSHVMIRGLKFTGNPNPNVELYYPIGRAIETLTDLKISQCIFIGEKFSSPIQVAVLSDGHQTVIDHCIFYNCRNGVVFWKAATAKMNDSMMHCIVYGAYQAGVWTARADSNFFFENNIVTKCAFGWIKNFYNHSAYRFRNCVITGNDYQYGQWIQPDSLVEKSSSENNLTEINVVKSGTIRLNDNKSVAMEFVLPDNYLNVEPGTLGYDLEAGLFKKKNERAP